MGKLGQKIWGSREMGQHMCLLLHVLHVCQTLPSTRGPQFGVQKSMLGAWVTVLPIWGSKNSESQKKNEERAEQTKCDCKHIPKSAENCPFGGQRTSLFDTFSTLGRPGGCWGPGWPPDRPLGHPGPHKHRFLMILGPFGEDSGRFFRPS